jgi:hypothetical protein
VQRLHPGYRIAPTTSCNLWEAVYPADDVVYALSVPGLDLACDRRFMLARPSVPPEHVLRLGGARRIVVHSMHSFNDWLSFALWQAGRLVRSLSLSPEDGIIENIGVPLPFEEPYWAGQYPVEPIPGWPNQDPYTLPFHPLDLGEDALRWLVGFNLEGLPDPENVPAFVIDLLGYHVSDPIGAEQASREAAYRQARETWGPGRTFQYRGGRLIEVDNDTLQPLEPQDP